MSRFKGQVVIYLIILLCYYETALSWGSCPWQQEDGGESVQGLRHTDHVSVVENNV